LPAQRLVDRAGGARRHARRRPGDRRLGLDQPAPRRHAHPDGPRREPDHHPFINPDGEKDLYNSRQPADDLANYLGPWSKILENNGYPPEEVRQAALIVLPDILRYDRTKPAAYPNGRTPTDDVYSMRFGWLSHGKVPPTGLEPHDDLLNEFPYLGLPNT
jgi:hypothetical protein